MNRTRGFYSFTQSIGMILAITAPTHFDLSWSAKLTLAAGIYTVLSLLLDIRGLLLFPKEAKKELLK